MPTPNAGCWAIILPAARAMPTRKWNDRLTVRAESSEGFNRPAANGSDAASTSTATAAVPHSKRRDPRTAAGRSATAARPVETSAARDPVSHSAAATTGRTGRQSRPASASPATRRSARPR